MYVYVCTCICLRYSDLALIYDGFVVISTVTIFYKIVIRICHSSHKNGNSNNEAVVFFLL